MEPVQLRATIASAQAGDAEAYEALLESYGPRLYGYFFRATGSHHDAEDLLGEMLLRLVQRLRSYDDRGRFEPWLFRIAANMIRDRIRRSKVAPRRLSLSVEGEEGGPLTDRLAVEGPDVEAGMLAAEAATELHEAMEKLDARTRDMLLLRHFAELSFKEIADLYDCPLGTVLARVHRGLKALRRVMGEPDGTE
ncbi:MAG: sigma-70 family RNA polymerase sigma factor [Phycisphaerae bacterium]|nr:sigma-70 family RNA polymerase sigma factor [Phycisphaerae bacterium]